MIFVSNLYVIFNKIERKIRFKFESFHSMSVSSRGLAHIIYNYDESKLGYDIWWKSNLLFGFIFVWILLLYQISNETKKKKKKEEKKYVSTFLYDFFQCFHCNTMKKRSCEVSTHFLFQTYDPQIRAFKKMGYELKIRGRIQRGYYSEKSERNSNF